MLNIMLLLALAQMTAPGIYVDEDGFVTLTEPPEVREQERRNLRMLEEADNAYREYRKDREGDLATLIDMHKAILESGMVLAPAVHQSILKRLAELHREYAKGETPEHRRALEKLHERIEVGMSQGAISNEDLNVLNEHYHGAHRRDHLSYALGYEEAVVALMTVEENLSAARLLSTMADTVMVDELQAPQRIANLLLRSRKRALAAAMNGDAREAQQIARLALARLVSLLAEKGNPDLCRNLIQLYGDDEEAIRQIAIVEASLLGQE